MVVAHAASEESADIADEVRAALAVEPARRVDGLDDVRPAATPEHAAGILDAIGARTTLEHGRHLHDRDLVCACSSEDRAAVVDVDMVVTRSGPEGTAGLGVDRVVVVAAVVAAPALLVDQVVTRAAHVQPPVHDVDEVGPRAADEGAAVEFGYLVCTGTSDEDITLGEPVLGSRVGTVGDIATAETADQVTTQGAGRRQVVRSGTTQHDVVKSAPADGLAGTQELLVGLFDAPGDPRLACVGDGEVIRCCRRCRHGGSQQPSSDETGDQCATHTNPLRGSGQSGGSSSCTSSLLPGASGAALLRPRSPTRACCWARRPSPR